MTNIIPQDPFETWQVRICQADAAMTEQAYLVVKAHNESLLNADKSAIVRVQELEAQLAAAQERTMAIRIIFDGPPGPDAGQFVEVETDTGESISIGEWIDRKDGYWALRIAKLPAPPEQEAANIADIEN